MDGIQMEPVGKYKADRNGSAKAAAWRNMVDQDLDDVAFLADTEKAREARDLGDTPVAVCSQRRALCVTVLVLSAIFVTSLLVVYATPQPDCPCSTESMLVPGQTPTESDENSTVTNKDRIATNGMVFPWRGARLPTFVIPRHYSLWLHPNLTTGEMRGEVSIDFRVDRDTSFVVLNIRDMNVTERALFKGGSIGPKVARALDFPPAEQTYIEFKEKLRRKYNYTLSLRFITRLDRVEKHRGFFLTGTQRHRCAISRFWMTHARSVFPCLDEPHLRATFKLTIVRDRFHVSLTNMPIVATEEAGFYLGHRLLQDEFASSPPMSPHMISISVCRLQRKSAPLLETVTVSPDDEAQPVISLYSDKAAILDESGPLLEWVQKTLQLYSYELNTTYPLPKFDIVVIDSGTSFSEGWGLITLAPATLSDTKVIARLLAQQWFGGLVSPRWWNSQWLIEALTSVLSEKAPPFGTVAERQEDTLLLDHILPALTLDSSNMVRAVASPRLDRADIEAAADDLSKHKGGAIVSMAIEAAGLSAGRAALARLLRDHRTASADARDLWRALQQEGGGEAPEHAWDGWCERAGYPLLYATSDRDVVITQQRFVMAAPPPDPEPSMLNHLLTLNLRAELDEVFYEPENVTEYLEEDLNATTTTTTTSTTKRPVVKTTKPPPQVKWVIPVTFTVGPLLEEEETKIVRNSSENLQNGTWYEVVNDTKSQSRWMENVTYLVWMNDTQMTIPELGRHKWVRYNVGARGLYRVAPQDHLGESPESAASRAALLYESGSPSERALLLDDAFVLSRARRLPASRAVAAAARLSTEHHWAVWRVAISHLSWWRQLLRLAASAPDFTEMLSTLTSAFTVYSKEEIDEGNLNEDQLWLSGALLTASVEWGNVNMTSQALEMFDAWWGQNQSIPEIYQEGAFMAGVRTHGEPAWQACWRALLTSHVAPKPLYSHKALLAALASPDDDWLLYRFAYTVVSNEAQRSSDWELWITTLCEGICRWRGASAIWRVLSMTSFPPSALQAAAKCLHQPGDYYRFKEMFGTESGASIALDTIALNSAWISRADADLLRYFQAVRKH
ncbi:uncharacterized protein LOC126975383 [Leptidea sinapis]|uniref:uncharacterized protein LOC126975383 n=1 Tax=Leptidea sinapis TaxID=189913 RepID=UPI00212DEE09|nr:uncharacterized protein LOC126975383 [Leptidea sinapis]